MGGTSTTSQQSSTEPWKAAQPALDSILGQLSPLISNSGLSGTSSNAINQLENNAQAGNPYTGAIQGFASNLLSGGGATNQNGAISSAYNQYQQQTNPLASNTDYNPMNTPGLADSLKTLGSDITGQINGQFASAGRDMSGMNTQTLARGLTQGLAPVLTAQYNQNIQNQQGAANNLYNAGNATAAALNGTNQQSLINQGNGVTGAQAALDAQNYTPTQLLNLEQQKQQIPAQNLGLLTNIGVPIAGLGSQSQGTSTSQMSGAQQFAMIMNGIGNLIPKSPVSFKF